MIRLTVLVAASLCMFPVFAGAGVEVVSFGDVAWRDNNLAGPDFSSSVGGWSYTRVLLAGERERPGSPRPYVMLNVAASSEDIPEENTLTYGPGVEIRPLARNRYLADQPWLDWLTRARVYAEYLMQSPIHSAKPSWNPDHDFVLGFDSWKETPEPGSDLPSRRFSELFVGAAYHKTDFYLSDYSAIRYGLNAKYGLRLGRNELPAMPYLVLDVNGTTRHDFFWQNRAVGGMGLRTQFRSRKGGRDTGASNGIKIYAEQLWVLGYLKSDPQAGDQIPSSDFRVGVIYELNRY